MSRRGRSATAASSRRSAKAIESTSQQDSSSASNQSSAAPRSRPTTKRTRRQSGGENLDELLQEAIKLFEHCENGVVHRQDLLSTVQSLGIVLTSAEQAALLEPASASSSSSSSLSSSAASPRQSSSHISVDEALDIIARFLSRKSQAESLQDTFALFSDGDPYIELHHLKKKVKELGDQTLGDRDLIEMIEHASDGSGRVSKEQFDRLMCS